MSLWQAADEATSELMADLYASTLRRRRPLGAAEALRQAQLKKLEANRRRHGDPRPEDQAAFIAAGDWR